MKNSVLIVHNLTTQIKVEGKPCKVVDGLHFKLKKGKTLAIVGESGSGKTMTALSILRILPKASALISNGKIFFKGQDLLSLNESEMRKIRGKSIAMIFQDPQSALNPVYTIGEQLLEVAIIHLKLEGKAAKDVVIKALDDVQLPDPKECMEKYPHQMSGGMLQRAMIAMALISNPDVLIADEPTTALDVTTQAQILSLLKELQKKRGMAILLITHDMGVVAEMADDVVVMYAGGKIEEAKIENLFDNPSHPYTQALFSAITFTSHQKKYQVLKGSPPQMTQIPPGCPFHPRCPYAMKLCQSDQVPIFSLPFYKDHHVKCWLFDKDLQWKIDEDDATHS